MNFRVPILLASLFLLVPLFVYGQSTSGGQSPERAAASSMLATWLSSRDTAYAFLPPYTGVKIAAEVPISRMIYAHIRLETAPFVSIDCQEFRTWLRTVTSQNCNPDEKYYLVRAMHNNAATGIYEAKMDSAGVLEVVYRSIGAGSLGASALIVSAPKEVKRLIIDAASH